MVQLSLPMGDYLSSHLPILFSFSLLRNTFRITKNTKDNPALGVITFVKGRLLKSQKCSCKNSVNAYVNYF